MSENPQNYAIRRHRIHERPGLIKQKKKMRIPHISLAGLSLLTWETVFFVIMGFLLSRAEVLDSLLPFGPAFFAAVVSSNRKQALVQVFPIALGLVTIVSGQQLICNMAVIGILTIVLLFYSVDANRQWIAVPALVFTSIIVAKGITLIFGHASDYLVMVTIFESLFASGLSLVFLVVIGALKSRTSLTRFTADEVVCIFVCVLGLIMGLGDWNFHNVELRSVVSRLLVLVAALLGGGGAGAGIGALVGIVPSLSEMVAPSIVGMYAFSGLLAGAFNGFGRVGVVMGFFLGNLLLALYLLNTPLILYSLAASAAAAGFFLVIPERFLILFGKVFNFNSDWPAKERTGDWVRRLAVHRLNNMTKVFSDLAGTLDELSQEVEAEEQNINTVLGYISSRICTDCTLHKMCWENDFYQTYKSIMNIFSIVESRGYASLKDTPSTFQKRCSHASEMVAAINCLYELYQKNSYWQRQMENTRNLIANQLMGSAEILEKLVKEIKGYGRSRELLEKNLIKALVKKNFSVDRVTVLAVGEKTIDLSLELQTCPGVEDCHQVLAPVVSKLIGEDYQIYQSNCSVDTGIKTCWFRMLASGAKKLRIGKAQIAKDEETICGDSSGTILLEDGKQILMLSDGMGTGSKAAVESNTTLALLEQLLETGFNERVAVNTINSVLMLRSREESFATVDLCIIDLYTGETDFVKIGGVPSFIVSGNRVKTVRTSSLPIGILHKVEMDTVRECVNPGDIIVMATDGLFTENRLGDPEQWMIGFLEKYAERDPYQLADSLLKNAINLSGGYPKDDITVLVAVIED